MIIEMRTYRIKPGLRSRFVELFRARPMPARSAHEEIRRHELVRVIGQERSSRRRRGRQVFQAHYIPDLIEQSLFGLPPTAL
jgi:hypothetical protein